MKVDVNQVLFNTKGTAYRDETNVVLTVGTVCIRALDSLFQGDKEDKPSQVKERWKLLDKVVMAEKNGGVMEIEADESRRLQERICQLMLPTTLTHGVFLALEGKGENMLREKEGDS